MKMTQKARILRRSSSFSSSALSTISRTSSRSLHRKSKSAKLRPHRTNFIILRGKQLNRSNGSPPCDFPKDGQFVFAEKCNQLPDTPSKEGKIVVNITDNDNLKVTLLKRFKQHIIGQDLALTTVATAIRIKETGWGDATRPLVFLFLGSSGVGKTLLAKELGNYNNRDGKSAFLRFDMSEYQAKHDVAKLLGSPPGYVGFDNGGVLVKQLKSFPDAVVLFDEIEKAHCDLTKILLQLFDEGRITDGRGTSVECPQAIFVMTSNLGSEEIADHVMKVRNENKHKVTAEDDEISETFKEQVIRPILKNHFKRYEFLGRINAIVYFKPFKDAELRRLVAMELSHLAKHGQEKFSVAIIWDSEVEQFLASKYYYRFGARSIKCAVQNQVASKLAVATEAGDLSAGITINLVVVRLESDRRNTDRGPTQQDEGLRVDEEDSRTIRLRVKTGGGPRDYIDIGESPN